MKFLYHKNAGDDSVTILGEGLTHLKVRRISIGDTLVLRNLVDNKEYIYDIKDISKKAIVLELDCKLPLVYNSKDFHIYWSIIDPKEIEKVLPTLSELGVSDVTFVYADRSQRNFKPNMKRLEKILINSAQQSGRNSMINIDFADNIESIIDKDFVVIDFCEVKLENDTIINSILVGPEGGFSIREKELLKDKTTLGLRCENILRSSSVVVAVSSKLLL